jgi:glycosyltransferase involved in cell wall biosynthesis
MNGQLEGRTAGPLVRVLYRGTERMGQRTIAVSAAVREQLLAWGLAPERVVHVPNGLALDTLAYSPERRVVARELLGVAPDATVIGTLGRLHKGKRCDLLLTAAAPLLGPDRVLLLVGAGPERSALEAQACDLGVADHVVFGGELPAAAVLSAMDVFASPSAAETFGLAILEALASGLPTVYRNCPALDELGAPVETALHLVDDSVETLRAGLEKALAEPAPRICPPALSRLDITSVARTIDELYESL